ncbi:nuclear transport factor 2 family protein [Streptomyces sp. NPDC051214]|uniref:nuclear transport factor 2 family protein n=1 Tax=Streptomyces sp. NPDC051214 TaxID=3155282 RepID=UPI003439FF24
MDRTGEHPSTPSHGSNISTGEQDDGAQGLALPHARAAERRRDVARIFRDIDTFDPDKFVAHLTKDVVFRFANSPELIGRPAVRQGVADFFATIAGLSHRLLRSWEMGDIVIVQTEVTYTRTDGKQVTVPNADILTFRGDKARQWRIYIDLAPVYAD